MYPTPKHPPLSAELRDFFDYEHASFEARLKKEQSWVYRNRPVLMIWSFGIIFILLPIVVALAIGAP